MRGKNGQREPEHVFILLVRSIQICDFDYMYVSIIIHLLTVHRDGLATFFNEKFCLK